MTSTDLVLDVVAEVVGDITIADAIVGGELERTIEGASTLTIDVHDPHRLLIRSPNLSRAIDLQYADVWFRLVKIAKAGDTVSLTFEDRDVAYLRTHRKSRKVSRNTMTRAQFVRSLVREVREHKIKFFSPEVNERQPIGKTKSEATPTKRTEKDRTEKRAQGISADAVCKVQGQRWVSKQRANAERVLDVANTLGAGPKATKALVLACITESGMFNLTWGDRDSQGILQVRISTSGSAARSRDIEWCCRVFLTKGFWGKGGAIDIAASRSSLTAGEVAQQVQGSAFGSRYDHYDAEADAIIEAYGGASGTDTGGTTTTETTVRKKYEFARGLPGQPEDSWTAIQRLATEVRWRAFMDAGTLYFVSEERLLKARARYVIAEDDDGINSIDFDIDQGKVAGEVRVSLRSELYDVPVGSVLAIREMGICNGRWLVATVRQSLFENDVELVLKALTPKLPEPAAETKTTTKDGPVTAGGEAASGNSAVMKCYRFADSVDKKNYRYAWGGGRNPPFVGPYDCSGFVSAVLHAGGMLNTVEATGGLSRWGDPGEGKYMTAWVKETSDPHQSHTFITFELEGSGKGKQEFAEAGGGDSSHTGWHKSRNKSGFVPRHWPGT